MMNVDINGITYHVEMEGEGTQHLPGSPPGAGADRSRPVSVGAVQRLPRLPQLGVAF